MATADFTIADVLAWARTKPADERYNFVDAASCALGQYLKETRGLTSEQLYECDPYFAYGIDEQREFAEALQTGRFGELVASLEKLCPETLVAPCVWTAIDAYLTDIEQVEV